MTRRLDYCLMYYPYIPEPIPCAYPEESECGFRLFLVGNKIVGLCKYRIIDLGLKTCANERKALRKKYEKKEKK